MGIENSLIGKELRTPKAAAIAGILFGVLLIFSEVLVWISIPANPTASDVISHRRTVTLAFNLVPFAGVAFLWFIAVVRNRLGASEDRFFCHGFPGKRVAVRRDDLYVRRTCGWAYPGSN
jgi:hypothetical protein